MMLRICGLLLAGVAAWAQIEVGEGAPSLSIKTEFQGNFYRNGFSRLVSSVATRVQRFGPVGLVQEFVDASNPSARYALVRSNSDPNASDSESGVYPIWQVYPGIYAAYKPNVNTYGYPLMDTGFCFGRGDPTCQYMIFDKNYAVFYYTAYSVDTQTFIVRDPYFTRWSVNEGLARMGAAKSAETAVTSSVSSAAATMQSFTSGAIYNITSGVLSGRINAVRRPIYDIYAQKNLHAGFLGFPITEELNVPSGMLRQTFEGGAIEYDPNTMVAVLRAGVRSVGIVEAVNGTMRLNVGDSRTVTAVLTGTDGESLTDRQVNWVSTNGRVVAVQGSGRTATIKAVGAGTANVTAVVEGRTSSPLPVVVAATCCAIGEGAPSSIVRQAFTDAVTRNRLNLRLPADDPVQRTGNGWTQAVVSPDGTTRYLIAVADNSATAWVVSGPLLERYLALGGPTGSLGYPTSDATSGGRQMFQNGALAGTPPKVVSGPILAKWGILGYESGRAGSPVGDAANVVSFGATLAVSQNFQTGLICALQSGPHSGDAFFVGGAILAKYAALGGPTGSMGVPWSDEFQRDGNTIQEFEGGTLRLSPGASEPEVLARPRTPNVDAQPATVLAGQRVRVAVGGFADGDRLRVSLTGRPDFVIDTPTGSYAWEWYVPSNASSSTVTIRAVSTRTNASASATLTVRALSELRPRLAVADGDNQATVPGAVLPRPLRVVVRDESGRPVKGVAVSFEASPGAQVLSTSGPTDAEGQAWATVRAPASEGVLLCTARVTGSTPVTFSARAVATSLASFPRFMQSGTARVGGGIETMEKAGAMVAAAAAMIRYWQDRGDLGAAWGLADPQTLNQFLSSYCSTDSNGIEFCDGYIAPSTDSSTRIVNLWRLGAFTGGNLGIAVDKADLASIRDAVVQGAPALLSLSLTANGAPAGSHFVVATGVDAEGAIVIHDPNPAFARERLSEYLNGFAVGSASYKAALAGVARILPQGSVEGGFLVTAAKARISVQSASGPCGDPFEMTTVLAAAGETPIRAPESFRMSFCGGADPLYQLDSDAQGTYRMTFTDLSRMGQRVDLVASAEGAFRIARSGGRWVVSVQETSVAAGGVVNAATFAPGIAPGGLAAIFGAGLARQGLRSVVEFSGKPATVVASSPFQLNVQVPADLTPGVHPMAVRSPFGEAQQDVAVSSVAPGIFVLPGSRGAVVNADGSLNSATSPAQRGQALVIYCTGLGAVRSQGNLQAAQEAVTVLLAGRALTPLFAGLTPGFVGLYQVNVVIPADQPPGLDWPLVLRQAGATSNAVPVSLQ